VVAKKSLLLVDLLEGPRCPEGHAPVRYEQHPDARRLRQLRYADVACRAKAAAARLSNATIIGIPGIGHAVSSQSPSAQAVVVSFLADPAAPDTSCVGALKPPGFTSVGSPSAVAPRGSRDGKRAMDDLDTSAFEQQADISVMTLSGHPAFPFETGVVVAALTIIRQTFAYLCRSPSS
jgi:hypothetical protein